MLLLLMLGGLILLLMGIYSIVRVNREYQDGGVLSNFTVVIVWFEYIFISVIVIIASIVTPWQIGEPTGFITLIGILLVLAGVVIFSIGIAQFGSFSRMSGQQTNQLITSGIYQRSRNPQNVGWYLALTGIAVMNLSSIALGFTLLFILMLHIYIIRVEEPFLRQMYGKVFINYENQTSRYWSIW